MRRVVCLLALVPLGLWAQDEKTPEEESAAQLGHLRRIYVDLLSGGESAIKIRDLLMTSLQSSKLFIVTENEAKADAILKGAADDKAFVDTFSSTEGINAHSNISLGSSSGASGAGYSRSSSRTAAGLSIGENESRKTEERKHEAIATVRLVSKDGDVIWSTTQESLGAKFMGAAADVADKVAKKLAADIRKARQQPGAALP